MRNVPKECYACEDRLQVLTGYERLPISDRTCFHCNTCVEDEVHICTCVAECSPYNELCLRNINTVKLQWLEHGWPVCLG